jgi:hypothetical protein
MTETLTAIALAPLALAGCALAALAIAAMAASRVRQPFFGQILARLRPDRVRARKAHERQARSAGHEGHREAHREAHVALAGMPPRSISTTISTAGRCPAVLFYLPVVLHCLQLGWRHRGFTLPSVANPNIVCGGFRGESKMTYLEQIPIPLQHRVASSLRVVATAALGSRDGLDALERSLSAQGLAWPLVAKPDIGSQGYGVRVVRSRAEFADYLKGFPLDEAVILQRLIEWEGEAGVHYVRRPGEARGRVFSLGFRVFPHVVGDGRSTLGTLIETDPRTRRMARRHRQAAADQLERVPAKGEMVRLSLLGSVRIGAFYYDGAAYITPELEARFDEIARAMPEFYFGRFDIRFKSIEALCRGEDFQILEVNGASAEAIHIWDPEQTVRETYRVLFEQFRLLYEIGAGNRDRGHRPISFAGFLALQWRESRLLRRYPDST